MAESNIYSKYTADEAAICSKVQKERRGEKGSCCYYILWKRITINARVLLANNTSSGVRTHLEHMHITIESRAYTYPSCVYFVLKFANNVTLNLEKKTKESDR